MAVLVVAEKPSVARDIAQVLGATTRGDGFSSGGQWIVTWAIGHLVALAEPHEMNAEWKRWRLDHLPLLPSSWPLVVSPGTRKQFDVVEKLLRRADVEHIVCATDAGREGELIFRTIYEAARAKKPVKRLWISSLTADAIAKGFRNLRDAKEFDRLADAARARSRADWLVGMNLSRLYSIVHDDHLSVGRVQTPTLAMLVARELEIRAFVPEDYLEVVATFGPAEANGEPKPYQGTFTRPKLKEPECKRLPPDGKEAEAIILRAKRGQARIASVDRQTRRLPPPQLYDLTELQRHANRLYGFTADRTLKIAQGLYEQRKAISYPRTDSRYLSESVAATLPAVVSAIEAPYRTLLAHGTGARPLGKRFVDDALVSDHHAIIPTTLRPSGLTGDEQRIYDLVCRRLLSAWHGDHVFAVTTVMTHVTGAGEGEGEGEHDAYLDHYVSTGTSIEVDGWKVLDIGFGTGGGVGPTSNRPDASKTRPTTPEPTLPGGLEPGMARRVTDAKSVAKKTRPPPRFTDGTLLTAMETAGRSLDEKELSRAMRDRGLGTPATRAAILETLLRREYVARDAKLLVATDKGIGLIERVHAHVKSPAMTGEWEAKLARIERGEEQLDAFMSDIERYVIDVIGASPRDVVRTRPEERPSTMPPPAREKAGAREFRSSVPPAQSKPPAESEPPAQFKPRSQSTPPAQPERPRPPRAPRPRDLNELLASAFGFSSFRPYQEDVCRAAAAGKDVLLVMPTGAGKSLCYQLPGIARGGTTLIISPLIALMEDQVAHLVARGFAAERIHSGRDRLSSRAACKAYLEGELDFLFIAPERLRVPGFPEMLARRKPTLIAIDEAHCISQWGHDFRPDYRMLGARLPLLRPAPVMALTATATPSVQDDIVAELGLESPERFIHGFRRTNIGVEIITRTPGGRAELVRKLLAAKERRPAIVYAPTRKESEELARELGRDVRAAAYHAGMGSDVRDDAQAAFLAGQVDVIVATTAFGMGIDKPDVRTVIHTALPATVEGYYQEIGRAGRDGKPSRALLLHSYVDTKTHEFFLERDYPEADVIASLKRKIGGSGSDLSDLASRSKLDADLFGKALEKLWIHGGALIENDRVEQGSATWRKAYEKQRAHKREQLDRMRRYAETTACRMLGLVSHFGDQNDPGAPCGLCDVCAPLACVAQEFRAPSSAERDAAQKIMDALGERDGRAVGQLHRDLFTGGGSAAALDRRALEHVLGALARAGSVRIAADEFVKDGVAIVFQRVWLSRGAKAMETGAPLRMVVSRPTKAASETKSRSARKPFKGGARGKGGKRGKRSRAR